MGRYDNQVYLFRCRDLDDFVRWRAHNQLATDLDLGSFGLWQHLCEIETGPGAPDLQATLLPLLAV
jgi:hypothetical protein